MAPEPAALTDFTTLTFDCYGTLIDWEGGMVRALEPLTDRSSANSVATSSSRPTPGTRPRSSARRRPGAPLPPGEKPHYDFRFTGMAELVAAHQQG